MSERITSDRELEVCFVIVAFGPSSFPVHVFVKIMIRASVSVSTWKAKGWCVRYVFEKLIFTSILEMPRYSLTSRCDHNQCRPKCLEDKLVNSDIM